MHLKQSNVLILGLIKMYESTEFRINNGCGITQNICKVYDCDDCPVSFAYKRERRIQNVGY